MLEAVALSEDGTPINYVQSGEGPGVVLVHGAMQVARSFDQLALALARSHRVVRYDRRGRGRNTSGGSLGSSDRLQLETQDLRAVLAASGARFAFGLSSGAILTTSAALSGAAIEKVALYEPPIAIGDVDPGDWGEAFLAALADERLGKAMALILKGTGDRELLTRLPRPVLTLLFGIAIRKGAPAPNGSLLSDLLRTVPADIAVQRAASALLLELSRLSMPILLIGGTLSHQNLTCALDRLAERIPHASRASIPGAGHIAADDQGKPAEVAAILAGFFRP